MLIDIKDLIMKKNIIYCLLFTLLGCTNPVDDLEIGEPFSKVEAITDSWTLSSVLHVDNLDPAKSSTDVTSFMGSGSLDISATSFTYAQSSGPIFLEETGSWSFDNEEFPIFFIQNSNTQLRLDQPINPSTTTMSLILERTCEDKVISSYKYVFTRN